MWLYSIYSSETCVFYLLVYFGDFSVSVSAEDVPLFFSWLYMFKIFLSCRGFMFYLVRFIRLFLFFIECFQGQLFIDFFLFHSK